MLGADRVVVGDDEAEGGGDVFRDALVGAELEGHLEGQGLAGLTLGGGLGAVGSHFGEPFFLRRGPLAHRQRVPLGAAQKSPARAACTRRAGAHAEDGEGRRICLARNSALAEGEIRRTQPLLAERVGLKAAHNRGE